MRTIGGRPRLLQRFASFSGLVVQRWLSFGAMLSFAPAGCNGWPTTTAGGASRSSKFTLGGGARGCCAEAFFTSRTQVAHVTAISRTHVAKKMRPMRSHARPTLGWWLSVRAPGARMRACVRALSDHSPAHVRNIPLLPRHAQDDDAEANQRRGQHDAHPEAKSGQARVA